MSDSEMQKPQRIKLDLKTTLEQFFMGLIFLSPVFIFIGFTQIELGDSPTLLFGAVITFVLSLLCYFATDNYYVLDLDQRQLLYRFKFLIFKRVSKVVDFSGIHAVTLNQITLTGKHGVSYVYVPTLVLFNGKVLPVADAKSGKGEMHKLANKIAKASGAEFVQSYGTTEMLATRLPSGRYSFKARTKGVAPSDDPVWRFGAIIFILVCVAFIAMVIYKFSTGA